MVTDSKSTAMEETLADCFRRGINSMLSWGRVLDWYGFGRVVGWYDCSVVGWRCGTVVGY